MPMVSWTCAVMIGVRGMIVAGEKCSGPWVVISDGKSWGGRRSIGGWAFRCRGWCGEAAPS